MYIKKLRSLKIENIIEILILLSIFGFLLYYFKPELLLSNVQTTGGDTAVHYYEAWYMHNILLPNGEIIGWSQLHMLGFPFFQYYFPLPFMIAAVLGYIIPFNIAFKITTVLGIFLLPYAAYFFMKKIGFKFPMPLIAAVMMLLILFTEINKHNGIYILDNLSGQFSNLLSVDFLLIFLGMLFPIITKKRKYSLYPSIALSGAILSHAMLTPLFAVLQSSYFLLFKKRRKETFKYLLIIFSIGFLISAFWSLPFIFDTDFSYAKTSYKFVDLKFFREMIDNNFIILQTIAVIGILLIIKNRDRRGYYLIFGSIILLILSLSSLVIQYVGNLPILSRYFPMYHIYMAFIAAYAVAEILNKLKTNAKYALIIVVTVVIFVSIYNNAKIVPYWIRWNYEGIEVKAPYVAFREMTDYLKSINFSGRITTELMYTTKIGDALGGGPFSWDLIPQFSGKPITGTGAQGLYSLSFSVLEVYTYKSLLTLNADNFIDQSKLLNVDFLLKTSDISITNLDNYFEFNKSIKIDDSKNFELYKSKVNDGSYVYVPQYEPVMFKTDHRYETVLKWFENKDLIDVPIVFSPEVTNIAANDLNSLPRVKIDNKCDVEENIGREEIWFRTNCVGKPHIIKISYHPGWKALSGEKTYFVSPNFILVYPKSSEVKIRYSPTIFGMTGILLSWLSIIFVVFSIFSKRFQNFVYRLIK